MRRTDPRVTERRPELSQHFMHRAAARSLVRRLRARPGDLVVEAGAGDGALTAALAEAGCRVVAVEKDERLYRRLSARFAGHALVVCHHADFLTFSLPAAPYRVVSNVPYGITAAVVRKLLHAVRPPDEALLVVQREAAEKFAGAPRETLFSLLHKPWSEIAIAGAPRRSDFAPRPRVRSSILGIRRREAPLVAPRSAPSYRAFVTSAFGHGSADVSRALRGHLTSRQVNRLGRDIGFSPHARTSQLTFAQWLAVFRFVEHEYLGHDPTVGRAAA